MALPASYELNGRSGQKRRTREALVTAARELVAAGHTPTVEGAAAAASVSRTTAYRYFPSQRSLLVAAHPEIEARSMLPATPPKGVAARLDTVVERFTAMIVDTEPQQRTMLRLSLEPAPRGSLPLRQGRAIGWIAEALEGLRDRLSEAELRSLVFAVRATVGVEALVWLVDVAGISREEALALMRWSAQSLLHAALTRAPPLAPAPSKKRKPARARSKTTRPRRA